MSDSPATSATSLIDDLREPTRSLRKAIPDTFKAFAGLHAAALGEGALSASTKELIALAIGVAKRCDGCIAYHAKAAARAGATAEEVAEALGVALLMDGGQGTVYGPRAFAAFLEFAGDTPG
jgi:AhpD family alkylhydroperoxidase